VAKDRAAPFSRKHRRYWLPVTGGMLLIGAINVSIGYCSYEPPPARMEKIELVIPSSPYDVDAGIDAAAGPIPPPTPAAPTMAPATPR
jgi:hypothetical protein